MQDLLEQWNQLEPELCKYLDTQPMVHDALYRFDALDCSISIPDLENWDELIECDRNEYLAVIQHAVQLALEPTGWPWSLNRIRRIDGGVAYIASIRPDMVGTNTSSECPATALLETYLAVLEHDSPTSPSTPAPHDRARSA